MGLKDTIILAIKEEITNDPEGLGYAGKTNTEIAQLMNEPYLKVFTKERLQVARINQIVKGISFSPNQVDLVDITDAKKA